MSLSASLSRGDSWIGRVLPGGGRTGRPTPGPLGGATGTPTGPGSEAVPGAPGTGSPTGGDAGCGSAAPGCAWAAGPTVSAATSAASAVRPPRTRSAPGTQVIGSARVEPRSAAQASPAVPGACRDGIARDGPACAAL